MNDYSSPKIAEANNMRGSPLGGRPALRQGIELLFRDIFVGLREYNVILTEDVQPEMFHKSFTLIQGRIQYDNPGFGIRQPRGQPE